MNHHELPNIWLSALTISSIVKRTFAPGHFFFQKCRCGSYRRSCICKSPPAGQRGRLSFFWMPVVLNLTRQSSHVLQWPKFTSLPRDPTAVPKHRGQRHRPQQAFEGKHWDGMHKMGTPTGQMSWDNPGSFYTEGLEIPGALVR